jgi:dTDP-4-amino-4,6-dideoxygalactose transaminase
MNCFEGGAIVTNDDSLAKKIRLMKNFGFDGLDNVVYLGTNGKMSEPSAAMGLTSLDALDDIVGANKRNYLAYRRCLENTPGVNVLNYDESERNNYQYVVLEIEEREFGLSRNTLVDLLHAENVRARRYFYPGCHRMEPYRSFFPNAGLLLPETEQLTEKVICLPTGQGVGVPEIENICEFIQFSSEHATQISEGLK